MPILIGAKPESDFTNPVGMLGDCHRRIERFLEVLLRVAQDAHGGPLNPEQQRAFRTALRYFREAAPKHTADEEESLFPRLRAIGSPEVSELLARIKSLEEEHDSAARSHAEIDQLGELWLSQNKLEAQRASRLLALLAQLREMYRHHIAVEDAEVFPVASAVLSSAARSAIGIEMAARRGLRP